MPYIVGTVRVTWADGTCADLPSTTRCFFGESLRTCVGGQFHYPEIYTAQPIVHGFIAFGPDYHGAREAVLSLHEASQQTAAREQRYYYVQVDSGAWHRVRVEHLYARLARAEAALLDYQRGAS